MAVSTTKGLQVWLPLVADLHNQGLSKITVGTSGTIVSGGKLGNCLQLTGTVSTGLSTDKWNYYASSVTLSGWFKFNLDNIRNQLGTSGINSSSTTFTGILLGGDSYGGLGLVYYTNNVYSAGTINSLVVAGHYRDNTSTYQTSNVSIPFDTWVHLTLVLDNADSKLRIYKDGIQQVDCKVPTSRVNKGLDFEINSGKVCDGNGPGRSLPCWVNDVRVYSYALSSQEIKELSRGLVGWWTADSNAVFTSPNLITGLAGGGQATISNGVINISGINSDTYFYLKLKRAMVSGRMYRLTCWGSGFPQDTYYNFPIAGQNNTGPGVIKIKNGGCSLIFTANDACANSGTSVILDDYGRNNGSGQITNFVLQEIGPEAFLSDISGLGRHSTQLIGNITLDASTPRYDKSLNIPAAATFITPNPFAGQNTQQEWTISCWVKPTALTSTSSINNMANGQWLSFNSSNEPLLYLNSGANDYYTYGQATPLNTWQHVVFVFKNSTGRREIWRNGTNVSTFGPNKTSTPATMADTITWFSGFTGLASDIRLYATALSQQDIQELYGLGH